MSLAAREDRDGNVIVIRDLGIRDYKPLWREMQQFTEVRGPSTADEIWFTEHPPVFTLGLNSSRDHLLAPGDIPVVQVDRGGQVTYHGPGQLMIYTLIDLKRAKTGIRTLVTALEQSVVDVLSDYNLDARSRKDAPGVYVNESKIASVGLRVRRGASYHGLAFNIDVDTEPFSRINPCGFKGLEVTSLAALGVTAARQEVRKRAQAHLLRHLAMDRRTVVSDY